MTLFNEVTPTAEDANVRRITIKVNGESRTVDVEPRVLLAHLIRQGLKMTGTHTGCDTTNCGACTVLVEGKAVYACSVLAMSMEGKKVLTVEGLRDGEKLHPIQQAFLDEQAGQCGYCLSGIVISTKALLDRNPAPSRADIVAALGNDSPWRVRSVTMIVRPPPLRSFLKFGETR